MLETGERDSLAYFATRRDKSVIFSPTSRAAVTYRVVAEVSLASADPVGHMNSWPGAIEAWIAEARQFGWFPAALAASEAGASAYVAAGLKAMEIGDEAIIEVESFSLAGPTMSPVRRAVERVRRAGYTLTVAPAWRPGLGGADPSRGRSPTSGGRKATSVASRWRCPASATRPTRGAWRCSPGIANGELKGLLSFVPWGRRGLSLDLMRRDRAAENGLTEFMVAGLVDACRDLGIVRISLNFAMFRGIFSAAERVGAGPVMRLTGAVLSVASKFWQLESLYRSNAKYLPRWVPRYMCHSQSMNVTRAAIAAGVAEGFLPGKDPVDSRGPDDTVTFQGHSGGAVRGGRGCAGGRVAPTGPTGTTADRTGAGAAPQDRDAGGIGHAGLPGGGRPRSTSLEAVAQSTRPRPGHATPRSECPWPAESARFVTSAD